MFEAWQLRADGRETSSRWNDREWTRGIHVDGGAIFENQNEVFSPKSGQPGGTARYSSESRSQARQAIRAV
jgi:hypothetical protein